MQQITIFFQSTIIKYYQAVLVQVIYISINLKIAIKILQTVSDHHNNE